MPANPSPIDREVASDSAAIPGTTTIEWHDRTWVIPAQRHFRHVRAMRNQMVRGVGNWDLMIAEVFLDPSLFDGLPDGKENQLEALWDLNPTDDELEEFTGLVAKAIGLEAQSGSSGN